MASFENLIDLDNIIRPNFELWHGITFLYFCILHVTRDSKG